MSIHPVIRQWVTPFCGNGCLVVMLSGAQGIGKTYSLRTLEKAADLNIAVIGLDDVYLTKSERRALGREVHPLCETRGPPGTHDLNLLYQCIAALKAATPTSRTRLPVFDKRSDDRAPLSDWRLFAGRPDVILVEGWLMGALPGDETEPQAPLNPLEQRYDRGGVWRAWQEEQLRGPYAQLWTEAARFLHLLAPTFDAVLAWRIQQEETTLGIVDGALPSDRRIWVQQFIYHYERITRRMLAGQRMAGDSVQVDARRNVTAIDMS